MIFFEKGLWRQNPEKPGAGSSCKRGQDSDQGFRCQVDEDGLQHGRLEDEMTPRLKRMTGYLPLQVCASGMSSKMRRKTCVPSSRTRDKLGMALQS